MFKPGVRLAAVFALVTVFAVLAWWRKSAQKSGVGSSPAVAPVAGALSGPTRTKPGPVAGETAAGRMARAAKILRDYDEMTAKFSADYGAAGDKFPGGLNAFLQQLNLLRREKHADLAAVLTPDELAEFEFRESVNGKTVQRILGDTGATDEQRRAVFQLMQAADDAYPLRFDLSPAGLLAGETVRVALQQKIRSALGDTLFSTWLGAEGPDFAAMVAFTQQQGLAPGTALDLWQAKNEFSLGQLAIKARTDWPAAQASAAEAQQSAQTRARVESILGPAAMQAAGADVLGWLPRPPESAPPGK